MIDPRKLFSATPIELTHDQANQPDAQATKALLNAYRQDDGWHCPRCDLVTTNPDAFAQHLIDELNTAIAALAAQNIRIRQPTPMRQRSTIPPPGIPPVEPTTKSDK